MSSGNAAAAGTWARTIAIILARAYRAFLLTLVAIAVLPVLGGWSSFVVRSGSMEPSISVGDVALAKDIGTRSRLPVGRVMVFDNPATDNGEQLIHRVVEKQDDGLYVTAGDANGLTDATPLPREAFTRQAVLLVPYIGLPIAWLQSGDWLMVLVTTLLTMVAFVLASRELDPGEAAADPTLPSTGRRQRHRGLPRFLQTAFRTAVTVTSKVFRHVPHGALAVVVLALAIAITAAVVTPTSASFSSRTRNGSSSWTVGSAPKRLSVQAVNNGGTAQIALGVRVTNTGIDPIELSEVVVRYWFTNDEGFGGLAAACDWGVPPLTCGNVSRSVQVVDPVRVGGDRMLEIRFPPGTLAPGESAGPIHLRVHRDTGSTSFDLSNDHSQLPAALADAPTLTGYLAGSLVWGTEPAAAAPRDALLVRHADLGASSADASINPGLEIVNTGTRSLQTSRLTLRYWFTRDAGASSYQGYFDSRPGSPSPWASASLGFTNLSTPRPQADAYLEVSFGPGAFAPNSSAGVAMLRFHKTDWSTFTETNDYSYSPGTTYQPNPKVTAYLDGRLIWGTEP